MPRNIEVKEFKVTLGGTEYTFRLDFVALLKFTKRYENAIDIFNNFLNDRDLYDNLIKILSCACVEKDFSEEELSKLIPFNFGVMQLFDNIILALVDNVLVESEGAQGKN